MTLSRSTDWFLIIWIIINKLLLINRKLLALLLLLFLIVVASNTMIPDTCTRFWRLLLLLEYILWNLRRFFVIMTLIVVPCTNSSYSWGMMSPRHSCTFCCQIIGSILWVWLLIIRFALEITVWDSSWTMRRYSSLWKYFLNSLSWLLSLIDHLRRWLEFWSEA